MKCNWGWECGVFIWEKVWLRLFFEPNLFPYKYPTFPTPITLHTYSPMKMERTECSETLAFKLQTPGNNPKENIRHSKHGGSLKSRINVLLFYIFLRTCCLRTDSE
jgi:hypothetical protein